MLNESFFLNPRVILFGGIEKQSKCFSCNSEKLLAKK